MIGSVLPTPAPQQIARELALAGTRFSPYFDGTSPPPSSESVAYIRVWVTNEPRANGSITVFLAIGTALNVRPSDLSSLRPCAVDADSRFEDVAIGAERGSVLDEMRTANCARSSYAASVKCALVRAMALIQLLLLVAASEGLWNDYLAMTSEP